MTNYNTFPKIGHATLSAFRAYIEYGTPMPDLFMHVVNNDLMQVLTSVPSDQIDYLHSVILWLYTEAPATAIGSPENVRLWIERGGRQGIRKRAEEARAQLLTPPHPYHRHLEPICEPTD